MLQGMTVASPPSRLIAAAASSQASALRLETTTLAPSPAQHSAMARPMPRREPVMIATLLSSRNGEAMTYLLGVLHLDRYMARRGGQAGRFLRPQGEDS